MNDAKSTKTVLDKDGWLISGDLGYIDDDGFIFIVGRIKDMFKYKDTRVGFALLFINLPNYIKYFKGISTRS